ncbi:MAG: Autoinducer 2 sensor kinase/phosphatase LuxQ [bacterium ADurb.Bin243]|nr:MAG: Autoinducer 2 sensor kinase/phosphatase LuxQ [bacterium ADurb.Bin243]HOD39365.1 ATP-binding protein [Candidatus Wallbacteria bacterium]
MFKQNDFEQLKNYLKHRLEWEKLILKISNGFITVSAGEIDERVNSSLAKIGSFMEADRCYIFELAEDLGSMSNTYEWCSEGIAPQIENNRNVIIDKNSYWMQKLFKLEVNHVPGINSLPPHAAVERQIMEIEMIKSLVAVPLINKNGPFGFIGFDMIKYEKAWSEEDITMLKIFSEIITNALIKKNMEAQLLKAKEDAEIASKYKSQFLANMSHEIRTPLNGILGFAKLLEKSGLDSQQSETLGYIQKSGRHLLALINDVLDFSKIESNMLEIENIEFCFHALVEDVINMNLINAANKNIELNCLIDKKYDNYLVGDPSRLKQILLNLVDNAVKFTEKGSVTLECRTQYENDERVSIEISVSDTGIGIPPERIKDIFKPFTQADGSITRKYGGTGLGLTICGKLICLLGGHGPLVTSEPGRGSRFSFFIHFNKSRTREGLENREPRASASQTCQPLIPPEKVKVLVAEDDPVNSFLMSRFLEIYKYGYKIVDNGLAAVKEASNSYYDIIFMDIQMSGLNGIEAAAAIRKSGINIPIIACTASAVKADINACLKSGMQSYIVKPFEFGDIIKAINEFVKIP